MAHKNEFLPFSNNATSNVIDQTSYESLDARKTGFSSGVAKSAQLNKVWRQSSIMASALGQFIADKNGVDILDDGDVPKLVAEMNKAISGGGTAGVKTFNGASGDITISQGNNITITKNGNDFKIAASGGSAGVTTLNNLSGAVNLVAGANVTITPNGNNLTIAASGGGGGAVTSVNGKTGAVTLTAADVGATTQAWVTQQGYATQTWVNQQGFAKVSTANTWTQTNTFNVDTYFKTGVGVAASAAIGGIDFTSTKRVNVSANSSEGALGVNVDKVFVSHTSGNDFTIHSPNAVKPLGGAWADASDQRLKVDIKEASGCLDLILGLMPVEYRWNGKYRSSEKGVQVGFIADHVQKVLPTAVEDYTPAKWAYPVENEDGTTSYEERYSPENQEIVDLIGEGNPVKLLGFKNDIFAYIVGSIKELHAKNVALEATVAALAIEVEKLKPKA